MNQPGMEEEDEGTMTKFGIILRDPKKSSANALTTYVAQTTTYYENHNEGGYDLWINFVEDFCDWDEQSLAKVENCTMRYLRNLLFDRNVYTPKDKTQIYKHIANLLIQPWQEWPAEVLPPTPQESVTILGNNTPVSVSQTSLPLKTATPSPINPEAAQTRLQTPFQTSPINSAKIYDAINNYQEQGFSKELIALTKLYTEEMKYDARSDAFDYKLNIFLATASDAGIPATKLHRAFRYMLSGDALNFYFSNQLAFLSMNLCSLRAAFKAYFEGREYRIARLNEWNSISLQLFVNRNKDKTLTECLDAMIFKLRQLQYSLDESLHGDSFIHQKIVTACEFTDACDIVCRRPPERVQDLIQDLRSSTTLHDRRSLLPPKR